ncbi:Coenzyme F420 hydrogenase/dehydrogenase, beta subunit C-terminal domain [Aliiruegeria lutimaris]|uniref:Coenzyme F420 hydrogenase subunit beta n=1 Tax=Aliiruegeria lutimaris TaxID=571298 RepID=A0A1G8WLX8_9RHOB|nr:Coenzyme F420 hydrogenase/dehydrogenase, beta subunit C-terminal domain [Aliiruegeria lutimaris]SDJ79191.1 coenzyme F420 hydrogenase subunit beta [Aliiruegeria lutimaris]
MSRSIESVSDVVACNLCTGCGACAGLFPNAIRMIEDEIEGRRPVANTPGGAEDRAALGVCAGIGAPEQPARDAVEADWGPVLACWEGYAADPDIRHRGSSGGAATALAAFAVESGVVDGVAHVTARTDDPRRNTVSISRDRDALLRGAGSRYAQASPAEILPALKEQPTGFIGKPCDVASLAKARALDAELDASIPLTIAIFCAGAPTLTATETLLDRLGVPKGAKLTDLRYRGMGWPGLMQARWIDAEGAERASDAIPYAEGWGKLLQGSRRWRCRICDDHTGALADISVGDPWHNPPEGDTDAGRSLIVARSEAGRALVEAAIISGALVAKARRREVIAAAQPNLLATNAAVWGRRFAMRLAGMPVPAASRASGFGTWARRLGFKAKAQSILGTLRRIRRDRLRHPVTLTASGRG